MERLVPATRVDEVKCHSLQVHEHVPSASFMARQSKSYIDQWKAIGNAGEVENDEERDDSVNEKTVGEKDQHES